MPSTLSLASAFILAASTLAAFPALAQTKAPQPLRILVGFPTGGFADVLARLANLDLHYEGLTAAAAKRLSDLSERYSRVIRATAIKAE